MYEKNQTINYFGRGNSKSILMYALPIIEALKNSEKIVLCAFNEKGAESTIQQLNYMGMGVNYKHMYENDKYAGTTIFQSRKTEAWNNETENWNSKQDVYQLTLSIENEMKRIIPKNN